MKAGNAIECPIYDYSQHNRSNKTICIEPRKVIIVEGILVLQDMRLRDLFDIKVSVYNHSETHALSLCRTYSCYCRYRDL